jgi:hypothetical protein
MPIKGVSFGRRSRQETSPCRPHAGCTARDLTRESSPCNLEAQSHCPWEVTPAGLDPQSPSSTLPSLPSPRRFPGARLYQAWWRGGAPPERGVGDAGMATGEGPGCGRRRRCQGDATSGLMSVGAIGPVGEECLVSAGIEIGKEKKMVRPQ